MQQLNAWLKILSRAAIAILLLVLFAGFLLSAGSSFGSLIGAMFAQVFTWLVETPGKLLVALAKFGPKMAGDVANDISSRLASFHDARLNLSVVLSYLVVFIPLAVSEPLALFKQGVKSLAQLFRVSIGFITSGESWSDLTSSYLKAGTYVGICILASSFLVSTTPTSSVPDSNPAYLIAESVQRLLPVQLVINFANAELDEDGRLSNWGVALGATRETTLKTLKKTMKTLAGCGTTDNVVTVKPYGFASEDAFRDLERDKSNKLNVQVANRRAEAVYQALDAMQVGSVEIKKPRPWNNFKEMECKRNAMIRVPESSPRDAFADRVVVLHLSSSGNCTVVQNEPQ